MRSRAAGQAGRDPRRAPGAARPGRVAGAVVLGLLAGCGVRIDGPPPPVPSPSPAEMMRQAAAERAARLIALAEAAEAADERHAEVLRGVAADSRTHLAALGGLWAPPDWATAPPTDASKTPEPAGTTPAPWAPVPEPGPGTADVAHELAGAAEATCSDATAADDPDLVALLASICLAQRRAAGEAGAAAPDLPGGQVPEDQRDEAVTRALAGTPEAADLVRALDAAGFALEVAAARADGGLRRSLAERAEAHRAGAERLAVAAGLPGTDADPRLAAYALGDGGVDPGRVEAEVLTAWAAVVGHTAGEGREAALLEMSGAADAARTWGAPDGPLPGLPG